MNNNSNSRSKYCSNCGESLENLNHEGTKKCPKCGIDLQTEESSRNTALSSVVEQLPYKSPGTAALIALIGGIFGLQGIGLIYVGKIGKGIGILVAGIVITLLLFFITISIQGVYFFESNGASPTTTAIVISSIVILIVGYLVLWIWQIFNARKLAKKFNESVKATGKEPW